MRTISIYHQLKIYNKQIEVTLSTENLYTKLNILTKFYNYNYKEN